MKEYYIKLDGCDDNTKFKMFLTLPEYNLMKRISEVSMETSKSRCMPRLFVSEIDEDDVCQCGLKRN